MAQAFKCDRCGKYFDQLPASALKSKLDRETFINLTIGVEFSNLHIMHLCLDCHQQLVEWFVFNREKEVNNG